jgi:hypothetical protein
MEKVKTQSDFGKESFQNQPGSSGLSKTGKKGKNVTIKGSKNGNTNAQQSFTKSGQQFFNNSTKYYPEDIERKFQSMDIREEKNDNLPQSGGQNYLFIPQPIKASSNQPSLVQLQNGFNAIVVPVQSKRSLKRKNQPKKKNGKKHNCPCCTCHLQQDLTSNVQHTLQPDDQQTIHHIPPPPPPMMIPVYQIQNPMMNQLPITHPPPMMTHPPPMINHPPPMMNQFPIIHQIHPTGPPQITAAPIFHTQFIQPGILPQENENL